MIFQTYADFAASAFSPRVCVIGSGPAGTTIARTLAASGIPVAIFEAGSSDYTDDSQAVYKGKVVGDPYFDLDTARLRYQGGTSNHWAGWCRVLDAADFEAKSWAPDTGWPIRRSDLEPYFDKVRAVLDLPPFEADMPVDEKIRWVQLIKSPAVRFAEKFGPEIEKSESIALVLNTYVTELKGNGVSVSGAKIWSDGKDRGTFKADYFVVCTGGLENSRLLLWSNARSGGAVVPHADALGRYWMEHPHFESGNAILSDKAQFKLDATSEAFFSPTPEAMQARGILNFGIRVVETPYQGVKNLLADLACQAPGTAEWMASAVDSNLRCAAQLHVAWEQAPLATNRVMLSESERDPLGVPSIELHWKKSPMERRTVTEAIKLFGETLAAKDLGRVRMADWLANGEDYPTNMETAGFHHMGGTRMGDDPAKSVVDADCRVHGMRNLYVGGSSVFATSGQANPTTTITALALRLGDHLGKVVVA